MEKKDNETPPKTIFSIIEVIELLDEYGGYCVNKNTVLKIKSMLTPQEFLDKKFGN